MGKTMVVKDSVVVRFRYYRPGQEATEEVRYFYGRDPEENIKRAKAFVEALTPCPDAYEINRIRKTIEKVGGSRVG